MAQVIGYTITCTVTHSIYLCYLLCTLGLLFRLQEVIIPASNATFLHALTVTGAERVTLPDALDPLSGCGVLNCGLSAYMKLSIIFRRHAPLNQTPTRDLGGFCADLTFGLLTTVG